MSELQGKGCIRQLTEEESHCTANSGEVCPCCDADQTALQQCRWKTVCEKCKEYCCQNFELETTGNPTTTVTDPDMDTVLDTLVHAAEELTLDMKEAEQLETPPGACKTEEATTTVQQEVKQDTGANAMEVSTDAPMTDVKESTEGEATAVKDAAAEDTATKDTAQEEAAASTGEDATEEEAVYYKTDDEGF